MSRLTATPGPAPAAATGARRAAVQVVYINYFSADSLADSLSSLRASGARELEVTVVDNSCDDEELAAVSALAPDRLIRSEENLGFARACNLGARAGRSDLVVFLNPDTLVPDGALDALVATLERRPDALVGPRHYADADMQFAHAPMRGARLFDELLDLWWAKGWDAGRPMRYLARRGRLDRSAGPVRVRSLSGGCVAMARRTFDGLGGWDESFWLYGEDVELCVRARRRGLEVLLDPSVGIVHFMERSARRLPDRVAAARDEGRHRFKRGRYGPVLAGLDRWATRCVARVLPRRDDPWRRAVDLDVQRFARPADARRWAVEIGRSPLFDNCLTALCEADSLQLPATMVAGLPRGDYFLHVAAETVPDRWRETGLFRFSVRDGGGA